MVLQLQRCLEPAAAAAQLASSAAANASGLRGSAAALPLPLASVLLQRRASHATASASAPQASCATKAAADGREVQGSWQGDSAFDVPPASRREAVALWREATNRWRAALLDLYARGRVLDSGPAPPAARPTAPRTPAAAAAPALQRGGFSRGVSNADQPPWAELSAAERQARLEWYRAQAHTHIPPLPLGLHPAASVPSLPFLGSGFAVPERVPPLPQEEHIDVSRERLRPGPAGPRVLQVLGPAAAAAAAASAARATALQAELAAEAAAEAAFLEVHKAAKRLEKERLRTGSSSSRSSSQKGARAAEGRRLRSRAEAAEEAWLEVEREDDEAAQPQAQERLREGVAAAARLPNNPQMHWKGGGWHNAELRRALEPLFPEPALQGALDQALAEVEASTSAGGMLWRNCLPKVMVGEAGRLCHVICSQGAAAMTRLLVEEAGVAPQDALECVRRNIWLLALSAERQARPALALLRKHGFSAEQPLRCAGGVTAAPEAAAVAAAAATERDGPTGAGPRWAGWAPGAGAAPAGEPMPMQTWRRLQREGGGSSQVGRMLSRAPQLLAMGPQQLGPLLQYLLRQLAVPPEDVERIFKQQTLLLQPGGLQRLRTTVAFLHGKLLTQEEVAHVISRVPKVLSLSPRHLGLKFFYLEEALGGGQEDVVRCPSYLTASLESLGARVTLAEALGVPLLLQGSMPRGWRQLLMSVQSAARAGAACMDGVSLPLLVGDTDREFAQRLGVPVELLRESKEVFRQGDWRVVLSSLGK